jgi:hypothetical protein
MLVGPFQEVTDEMTALGVLLAEPAIQVVLLQLIHRHPVAVEPVQQLEGNQDASA